MDKQVNHPHYGEIIYDNEGLLVCHICGKHGFRALGGHVRMVHSDEVTNMKEYKKAFGLDVKKGILIEETRLVKARRVRENGTINNLFSIASIEHRFKKGSGGRRKDKISEQTRRKMVRRFRKHEEGKVKEE